jgi:hypothetical protein
MNNDYTGNGKPETGNLKHVQITVRKATEEDFPAILSLVKELALFQNSSEKILNTVDQMVEEKDLFRCFVAECEQKEIVGIASFFLPIIHGLVNHFTLTICM